MTKTKSKMSLTDKGVSKEQGSPILASPQDKEIFFEALVSASKPESKLVAAARKHKMSLQES